MRYLAAVGFMLPYIVLNYGAYRRAAAGERTRLIPVEGFPERGSGSGVPHPGMRAIGILLPGLLIGRAVHRRRAQPGTWTPAPGCRKRKKRFGLAKKRRR